MQRFVMPFLQVVILFYSEFFQSSTLNKPIQCFCSKHFSSCCKDHLFHIFPADPETSTADTRDDLVFWIVPGTAGKAQFAEMLNARNFVAGRAVILCDFRFDNYLRVEFTWYNEVRCLVETFDTFRPLGFTETDPRLGENFLNRDSRLSPMSSLTESRCPAKGLPRNRS